MVNYPEESWQLFHYFKTILFQVFPVNNYIKHLLGLIWLRKQFIVVLAF